MYQTCIKRLLDIIISLTALVLFSPILIIVAILVRCKLGSPVIFHQDRPGYHEKVFKLCKFRSMTDERDENGELLADEIRLTSFGKKLRETSLDELPELWNILKGDMSIVGPRPLLVKYLPLYNDFQRQRHNVKPGLTGWAQVNGRNSVSWEQRFEMDVYYVEHMSFLLDVKILFQTIAVVFKHNDINSSDNATMEAFHGTEKGTETEARSEL